VYEAFKILDNIILDFKFENTIVTKANNTKLEQMKKIHLLVIWYGPSRPEKVNNKLI